MQEEVNIKASSMIIQLVITTTVSEDGLRKNSFRKYWMRALCSKWWRLKEVIFDEICSIYSHTANK